MSKYVISEPQFLKIFDKMFRKDFEKLSRKTHPKYEGMVFWLDEYDLPILAYVSYINTLKVNNQLRLKHSSTFDLSLSDFRNVMKKWSSENLNLPEDIKIDFMS